MNGLDRIIGYFSPKKALARERTRRRLDWIQNSGYGNYGASLTKKSLKGWIVDGGSAAEDIHENLPAIRIRSRDLYSAKIPLYRFHPSPAQRKYTTCYVNGVSGWRITTDVSAADNRGAMLRRHTAFIATFQSGHTGIFSRTGEETASGKDKLKEWSGYSVKDMLDYPEAREAIQERAAEIVQSRVDHELLRALDEMG